MLFRSFDKYGFPVNFTWLTDVSLFNTLRPSPTVTVPIVWEVWYMQREPLTFVRTTEMQIFAEYSQ